MNQDKKKIGRPSGKIEYIDVDFEGKKIYCLHSI
jgi:hypothetical protein